MKNETPASPSGSGRAGDHVPPFLQSLLGAVRPPEWMVVELQNKLVLFLNHVLMQEKAAQDRLRRQQGKPVRVQWGDFHITLTPTPAGLFERALASAQPELSMTLLQTSPLALVQGALAGDKPAVDIQGDVQLAAEVAWLVDNVRWDVEEDLSRFVGDAAAHTLVRFAGGATQGLRAFLARASTRFAAAPAPSSPMGAAVQAASPASDGGTAA
jgi:ubiquinone biosynthesis protein UbiJ